MIKQDFFDAEIEYDQQQDQSYDYVLTKRIAAYNTSDYTTYQEITGDTYPDAYYLGWMKYENIPTTFLLSGATTGENTSTLTTTTPADNYNIGYVAGYYDYSEIRENGIASTSKIRDGRWKVSIGNTSAYLDAGCNYWRQYRFPNRFNVGCINYSYLHVCYAIINMQDNSVQYFQMNVNAEDFEDWITGIYQITIPGTETTFELLNGAINDHFYQTVDIGGVEHRVVIFSYQCFPDRPVNRDGNVFNYLSLIPNVDLVGSGVDPAVEGTTETTQEITMSSSGAYYYTFTSPGVDTFSIGQGRRTNSIGVATPNGQYYPANTIYNYPDFNDYVILPNGYNGTFERARIAMTTPGFMWGDNCFDYCDGSAHIVVRMYKPSDIIHHASILPRWKGKSTDPATHGLNFDPEEVSVYYPEVLDTNEFTGRLITGTPEELEDILQPWQFDPDEWENDPYEPEDKPPYGPEPGPGPTPQETEPKYPGDPTYGTTTRIVPTLGVNFYALNNSLAQSFIQRLWGQPKNFYEAIQIAGQQVDSIFDYIQSFRFYPINYDFSSSNVYPVIFGTGAVLKESDGDTNFQLSSPTNVQYATTAGSWNLSDPIYHWRNNFLDYSPYLKMSIYLPFAGTIELSPEAVASHTDISAAIIRLAVSLDISSGTITYYVVNQADTLLAQKTAKIAIDLPLSGNNAAEQSAAILRAQFSTIKQVLGMGTSAISNIAGGAAEGGAAGVGLGLASTAVDVLSSAGDIYLQNSLAHKAIPVEVQGMGGTISALAGGQYPYLTINRQKVSNPPNYAHTTGYLVDGTYAISSLRGFTVCRNIDVSGIGQATDKEKAQIKQIMESGFYC